MNDTQKVQKVIAEFCVHPIEKIRHKIEYGEFLWEVDEYKGENEDLVIAEVEFEHEEDYRKMLDLGKPPWVGKEITGDAWQYTNARLSVRSTHVVVSFCLTHMGCFSIVLARRSKFSSTYFYSRGNQSHCFRRDSGGALIIGKNH